MAKVFDITGSPTTIKLDSKNQGEAVYTVKNVTGRKVRGRAGLDEKDPAASKKLAYIQPPVERDFDVQGVQQYILKVSVPTGTLEGKYTVRPFVSLVDKPDEGDYGPASAFEVPKPEPKKPIKWWIPAAIGLVVLLLIGGGVAWWLMRDRTPPVVKVSVPNLRGKTIEEATTLLSGKKLEVGSTSSALRGREDVGKVVDQDPKDETQVDPGTKVNVVLGKASAIVPALVGQTYAQAQQLLAQAQLPIGTVTNQITGKPAGTVLAQNPPAAQQVSTDTHVNLTVEQASAVVPSLLTMTVNRAVITLQSQNLRLGTVSGRYWDQAITGQSPAVGQRVPLGSQVNVTVPGPVFIWSKELIDARIATTIRNLSITTTPLRTTTTPR